LGSGLIVVLLDLRLLFMCHQKWRHVECAAAYRYNQHLLQRMSRKKITCKGIITVLKNTFQGFSEHKITKLSGSLAYYTVY
jgi:hypothetical protein